MRGSEVSCHLAIEGDAHGWVDWELRINDRLQDHPPIWQLCVAEPAVALFPVRRMAHSAHCLKAGSTSRTRLSEGRLTLCQPSAAAI